jgi:hypothetical protein
MLIRAVVAILIYLGILTLVFLGPPRWGATSGLATVIDKHHRLDHSDSPRIVLIGGSNVSTGVDSAALQQTLHRTTINMALGASLGLAYMLEEVKDDAKPGDLFVVMPEYDYFFVLNREASNARLSGSSELLQLAQVFPRTLKWIVPAYANSATAVFDLLYDVRHLVVQKAKFNWKALSKICQNPKDGPFDKLFEPTNTIYTRREKYNAYGDFVGHIGASSPGIDKFMDSSLGEPYKFDFEASTALERFGAWAQQRHANVVVLPPILPSELYDKRKRVVDDIFEHWKQIKTVSILAQPSRYTLPKDDFFDTPYHVNALGRQVRTQLIIEDLSSYYRSCRAMAQARQPGLGI